MNPFGASSRRLNIRIALGIAAVVASVAVAVFVIHRMQVRRNAAGLADLARAKVANGQPAEAIALFARYLSYRPNDAKAYAELARLLVAKAERPDASGRDRAMAYDILEMAVSKNPQDRLLRTKLADFMLRSGRWAAAGQQLDMVLGRAGDVTVDNGTAITPEERDTLAIMRARAHLGTANYQQAAELLSDVCGFDLDARTFLDDEARLEEPNAARITSVHMASVFLAALLEEKLKDAPASRRVLDHLVEFAPGDSRGWLARANWHRSHADFPAAAADLAKAIAIAPDDPDTLFTNFEIALAQKRFVEAEQLAAKARSLFPRDERTYRGLAAVAARQGDLDRAIAVLREGLAAKPNETFKLRLLLSDILIQHGKLEDAEQAIAAVAEQYGASNMDVSMLEARLLIARRSWLEARKKLESVRPLVATSDELTKQVDLMLGQCFEQLGDFDEQLAANRRVLSQDHTSLLAQVGAAAALSATGKTAEALAEYEMIAASLPPDQLAAMAAVWSPLLQLRMADQMKRPPTDRTWSQIDALLDLLEQSPNITATQLAILRSDTLIRQGDSAAAETVLRKHAEAEPNDPQTMAALMMLTGRMRGADAARRLLADAPPEIADDPTIMLAEAQLAARAGATDTDSLIAKLEAKAEKLPDEQATSILASIGQLRRGLGNTAEAERLWNAALARRDGNLQVRTFLLEVACEQGDIPKAKAAAAAIGRLAGESSPQARMATAAAIASAVRTQRANVAEKTGNAATASATESQQSDREQLTLAYNLLIEAENDRPGWMPIQKLFAEVAILRGDIPEAIDRLQRASRMGPADPSVLRRLLSLLYASNRIQEAQQTLALLGPDGLSGLERLSAEIELGSGQFDSAVALAERGLASRDDASAGDLLWFGQLLARAGKIDRAVEVLQRAVDAEPKRMESWLALLSTQFSAGQRRPAERTLERAEAALDPPQRQMVLAQGNELLGRLDDADRYFREAAVAAPDSALAARSLSSFLVRRGQITEAQSQLRGIIATTDNAPDSLALRAWARRTLAVLLSQSGGYRSAEEALVLLEHNAAADGTRSHDDMVITIGILANRPEPGSWRRALDLLDEVAKRQPLANDQRLQRVQLLEKCGRWEECRNDLVALVSRPSAPLVLHSMLIEKLMQHGERDSAKLWLKKLADRIPDASVVLALKAKLALEENDRATAVEAARKLMPEDGRPIQPEQLGSIASLMEQLGFDKAADKAFERYAATTKSGVLARAAFLGRQHRGDDALDLLEQQWDRLPLLPLLQTALLTLRQQGTDVSPQQVARLDQWFEKANRQDPGSLPIAILFADFHSFNGRDAEAVAIYRQLLARQDVPAIQRAVVANNLAFLLATPETAAEAEGLVGSAIEELGPNPDILDTRGVVLLAAGKTSAAVADLKEAVMVPSATKYLHLACALAADRQPDAAKKALSAAKALGLNASAMCEDDRRRLTAVESELGG